MLFERLKVISQTAYEILQYPELNSVGPPCSYFHGIRCQIILTLEMHLQRHPSDDDRRNMYNMAPHEDLDDKFAEPPPKWATHFASSQLEESAKKKEKKLMKQKPTQGLDPNPTQSPTLYYSDVEKPKKRKKYQPAAALAKQSPSSSRDAMLPHHLQVRLGA